MTQAPIWPVEVGRALTVADLERTPCDGNRYELVNGVLVVSPFPGNWHNLIATRLMTLLMCRCPAGLTVIPDIAVLRSDTMSREEEYPTIPPALVIEVAAASTAKQDRTSKKDEYSAFGIDSYWLVTPDHERPVLTAYELVDGTYQPVAVVSGEELFRTDRPFQFSVVPAHLVAEDDRWRAVLLRG